MGDIFDMMLENLKREAKKLDREAYESRRAKLRNHLLKLTFDPSSVEAPYSVSCMGTTVYMDSETLDQVMDILGMLKNACNRTSVTTGVFAKEDVNEDTV